MPLYEYECDTCGHRFEVIQKFSDPLVETCPKCGASVHKLFSSPAIQFKGTGWYITDYAKKDSTRAGETGKAPKADATPDSKSSTPGESKTGTKSDSSSGSSSAGSSGSGGPSGSSTPTKKT